MTLSLKSISLMMQELNICPAYGVCGVPGSVAGIATGYGLDSPGIEFSGAEIFHTCPNRSWGPTILVYNGYLVFPGGRERPGRDTDPSPLSSAVVKKE